MVNYGHYKTVLLLLWGQWRYAAYACTIDRGWAGPPGPKLDETDFRITRRQFCSHNLRTAGLCQMVTDGQSVDQLVYSQQRTRIYKNDGVKGSFAAHPSASSSPAIQVSPPADTRGGDAERTPSGEM